MKEGRSRTLPQQGVRKKASKSDFSGKNEHGVHNEEERQALKEDDTFVKEMELTFVLVVFKSFSHY